MSNQYSHDVFSAGDFLEMLFRHKKKLIIVPLLVFSLGALIIFFYPRTYRSEAKLFLQVGRESVGLDPTATTGKTIALQQSGREDEVKSAIDLLESRGVISKAVERVGADVVLGKAGVGVGETNPVTEAIRGALGSVVQAVKSIDPISDAEEATIRVEKKLKVDAERDSTVILVRFDAKTPELAQAVCQAIVEVYREEHVRVHRNPGSGLFFEEQRDLLRQQLDEAIETVRNAKNSMGLASIAGRRDSLEAQLKEIDLETFQTQQDLATAQARVADLTRKLGSEPERITASTRSIPNEGADLLREQLYALEVKETDLKARYSASHPLVTAISNQIAEARKIMDDQQVQRTETTDDINPIHRQLALDLKRQSNLAAGYQARVDRLHQQREAVLVDITQLNRHQVDLDKLERAEQVARTKFFQYADSLEQARIDSQLAVESISNVSVAQAATLAEKPVSPSKLLVGLATLVLALGATASLILGSERINDKLRDDVDVEEALEVPVFAAIPNTPSARRVLVN